MSDYLSVLEIVAIHDILIDTFGGAEGIRDVGALEAAAFRPTTGYYEDPIEEAAALMESLTQNHPFLDGKKRTAFAAADVHLRLNGYLIVAESSEAHDFLIEQLERGALDKTTLEAWLRDYVEPLG